MALSLLNDKNQKDGKEENGVWFIPEYENYPELFPFAAFPLLLLLYSHIHSVTLLIK